jgi:hypothetical protein
VQYIVSELLLIFSLLVHGVACLMVLVPFLVALLLFLMVLPLLVAMVRGCWRSIVQDQGGMKEHGALGAFCR